ncbi:MAG: hypothetical protein COB98_03280 [Flavobacteriaceae bacterium]|nr:MAG: hypothetical protein COB98_03280 [Flavobacteriaceae bacterium]
MVLPLGGRVCRRLYFKSSIINLIEDFLRLGGKYFAHIGKGCMQYALTVETQDFASLHDFYSSFHLDIGLYCIVLKNEISYHTTRIISIGKGVLQYALFQYWRMQYILTVVT